ncbi:hypothetical protein PsorP6_001334 [Peronosclerospora sorghi]|uniref:Uncharacterized protein n=1 Tax=Peronosclerospora sorghi TaxID=230839 RepID=A0ACC0WX66_9STRA|nr:hypothetical protein PsorP6_001334 [Peronosclerospora sorghi]
MNRAPSGTQIKRVEKHQERSVQAIDKVEGKPTVQQPRNSVRKVKKTAKMVAMERNRSKKKNKERRSRQYLLEGDADDKKNKKNENILEIYALKEDSQFTTIK